MNKRLEAHRIPGTSILVDAFRKPVAEPGFEYILSHFHGDHYGRLSDRWDAPLHCSPLTGRLLVAVLGVREELVRTHGLREKFELGGAAVEFLDAEHCPGAVMVLAVPTGSPEQHLHTGDFRATPRLVEAMRQLERPKVHTLLLDSTYALSKSSFPDQTEVIERIAADLSEVRPGTLILVAAYSVGKERVILRAAEKLDCRIYAGSERRRSIYSVLDLSEQERSRFTLDPAEAQIHVVPFGFCGEIWPFYQPNFAKCEEYLSTLPYASMVGVLPTGHADASNWNRKHEVVTRGRVTLRLYAYSEHSSPEELATFVGLVRPVRLVPTVFRDEKEASAIVRRFQPLLDQAGAARRLFGSAGGAGAGGGGGAVGSGAEAALPSAPSTTMPAELPTAKPVAAAGAKVEGEAVAAGGFRAEGSRPEAARAGRFPRLDSSASAASICLDISDEEGPSTAADREAPAAEGPLAAAPPPGTAGDAAIAAVLAGLGRDAGVEEARSLLERHNWNVSAVLGVEESADGAAPAAKQRKSEGAGRQATLRSFFGGT